jgi:uncharacterized membrane protein
MQNVSEVRTKKPYGSSRVAAIDAARGAAMFFVCLAHFADSYQFASGADDAGGYLVIIGMVASPTFVIVSGLVAGFLAITRSSSFTALRYKLFDRGLFLLVVGHVILAVAGLAIGWDFVYALKVGYITDAIGFAVMIGPFLVARLRATTRLALAIGVFVLCWTGVFWWTPSDGFALVAKHYLIGMPDLADWSRGDFPLVPWFAVYLAGTVLGERLGIFYRDRALRAGNLFLAKVGLCIFALGAAGKITAMLMRRTIPVFLQSHQSLASLLSSYQKFPPGPVYIAFFGGAGLLLVAGILEAGNRRLQPFVLNQLRQIGLASLFVYVLQFWVYVVVIRSLHLPYTPFWPAIFFVTLVFLAWAAAAWNRREGNRFLTVGVGPILDWRARRGKAATVGQIVPGSHPMIFDRSLAQEPTQTQGLA